MQKGKVFKKGFVAALVAAGAVSVAQAAPVLKVSAQGSAAAQNAEANFLAGLYPGSGVTETFEGLTVGAQSGAIDTAVGTFTQNVAGTGGLCDAGGYSCAGGLAVLDDANSPFNGRFATPEGAGNSNWLDSFDSQVMTLTVDPGYTSIGFYMTDPNDMGGRLTVGGVTFTFDDIFGSAQPDGSVYYISLYDEAGLGDIVFYTNDESDGYGIDNVTVGRVPEPGTLALLGLGLVGVGLSRRRKS